MLCYFAVCTKLLSRCSISWAKLNPGRSHRVGNHCHVGVRVTPEILQPNQIAAFKCWRRGSLMNEPGSSNSVKSQPSQVRASGIQNSLLHAFWSYALAGFLVSTLFGDSPGHSPLMINHIHSHILVPVAQTLIWQWFPTLRERPGLSSAQLMLHIICLGKVR